MMTPNLKHIDIDLTTSCNLDCVFCHLHYFDSNKTAFLKYEEFLKIEHILPQLENLTLFGKFEPLLCKDFVKIFEKICEYKNIETYFSSNGLLLSEKIIKSIVGRLKYLTISATGMNNERYAKYMGEDSFDILHENLKQLNEYKLKNNTKYPILRLSTVGMVDTLQDFEAIIDFAKKYKMEEGIQVTSFIAYSEDMQDQILKSDEEYFKKRVRDAKEYAKEQNVKFKLQSGDFDENDNDTSELGHKNCNLPWERLSIQPDGEVYPCPVSTTSIGNFFKSSVSDIFNSKEMEKFREGVNNPIKMNKDCARCIHCRHKSINNNQNNDYSDVDVIYSQMKRKKKKK